MARMAVLLACDPSYAPYALFLLDQIRRSGAQGDADLVLASIETLDIPQSLRSHGIRQVAITEDDVPADFAGLGDLQVYFLKPFALNRLSLEYDRILYLDSDIFFEGGNLVDLMTVDLGGKAIGAVRDVPSWFNPNWVAQEFLPMNAGPIPYLNAGVLLVDSKSFRQQEIFRRMGEYVAQHLGNLPLPDQSALNGALQGDFAEISPVWNWILYRETMAVPDRYKPVFWHFAGYPRFKPWNDPQGRHDPRFRTAYLSFMKEHFPNRPELVAPPVRGLLRTLRQWNQRRLYRPARLAALEAHMARFADPLAVIPHARIGL